MKRIRHIGVTILGDSSVAIIRLFRLTKPAPARAVIRPTPPRRQP